MHRTEIQNYSTVITFRAPETQLLGHLGKTVKTSGKKVNQYENTQRYLQIQAEFPKETLQYGR
jgi:hypothetical protein